MQPQLIDSFGRFQTVRSDASNASNALSQSTADVAWRAAGGLKPFWRSDLPFAITVSASVITLSTLEPIASYDYWNGVGQFQWYVPVVDYTVIRLTSGGNFQSLQFLASSGFIGITTTFIAYQVLERGAVI